MVKGINELDLTDCVQCTPSYRHLPDDVSASETFDKFIHNTQFDVLFDHMVCVVSHSYFKLQKFTR